MQQNYLNQEVFPNRFKQSRPKIGIRPVIDGRRKGIRESLEAQTLEMAHRAARLYTQKLRHPDGAAVECVVPNSCIGGHAEAAAAEELFQRSGVHLSLTVTPCWCYGTETMDMNAQRPKAVWGLNATQRPGAVYLAAVLAGYAQKGLPAFGIYGCDVADPDNWQIDSDVEEKLLQFAQAGLAVAWMAGKTYCALGSVSMGIAGSMVQEDFFQIYLGMRNMSIDMSEILRRMREGIYDPQEASKAQDWVQKYCKEGADLNPKNRQKTRQEKDQIWKDCVLMALIAKDIMNGNPVLDALGFGEEALGVNAIAAGFQGQRHWTDHLPNGDFMESILNSSFDWNGMRAPYILATENDSLNAAAMLFGWLLTGTAQVFADVRTYWSPSAIRRVTGWMPQGEAQHGFIHLINSGSAALDGTGRQSLGQKPAIKPFWEISQQEVQSCLENTVWPPAMDEYFHGGGYSSSFCTLGGMPVTLVRVNLIRGLGPVLQIAEGVTVELPAQVHACLSDRTNPTWPCTWFVPRLTGKGAFADVYSVMASWGANHGSFCYGHIGQSLITLASMLRIPVCMHNCAQEKIFRPAVWKAFGMDEEGSDYRACASFGPLYR